ncbi:MAG: hypothetical protein WC337_06995 [Candidatus Muiribacteriota bacterium]
MTNVDENTVYTIYTKLIEVARNRGLITYYELNKILPNKNYKNFLNPFQPLFDNLNALNNQLHEEKKPLITSLVINKKTGKPGKGFFYVAKELKIFDGNPENIEEKDDFWLNEKLKVYKFDWK